MGLRVRRTGAGHGLLGIIGLGCQRAYERWWDGLSRYRHEFIDPIVEILGRPAYADLRIVTIVEPGMLDPFIIEGRPGIRSPECDVVFAAGSHVDGVRYALGQLGTLPNVYNYLDISSAGRLGWDDNLSPAATLAADLVAGDGGPGFDTVTGFATNVGDYPAAVEPFLPDPDLVVGGIPIWETGYYEFNRHLSADSYA